jgi:hypothetical protein
MSKGLLFGHRLDAVEWAVLLTVCAAVTLTLMSMSFVGLGVLFGGIPPGLGAVWVLRRFRPSLVHQPPAGPAARGEGSALLSLLLFAVGSMVVLVMLISGVSVFTAPKPSIASATIPFGAALVAVALFYGGARLRRGA